jgi:hypothetical protein
MSAAVHRSPNRLWRSNFIFNLWSAPYECRITYGNRGELGLKRVQEKGVNRLLDKGHTLVQIEKTGAFYKQYRKETGKDRRVVVTHTMLFLGPVEWHRADMRVPFGGLKETVA